MTKGLQNWTLREHTSDCLDNKLMVRDGRAGILFCGTQVSFRDLRPRVAVADQYQSDVTRFTVKLSWLQFICDILRARCVIIFGVHTRRYRSLVSCWPVEFSSIRLRASHFYDDSDIGLADKQNNYPALATSRTEQIRLPALLRSAPVKN